MKTMIILCLLSLNVNAITFEAQEHNGKLIYSNVPGNCIRDGLMVCYEHVEVYKSFTIDILADYEKYRRALLKKHGEGRPLIQTEINKKIRDDLRK